MKKRILITAGMVYGRLDDNKLVGNRARGIWASWFAEWLLARGHDVTFLIADTQRGMSLPERGMRLPEGHPTGTLRIITHSGFWNYLELCAGAARTHDAAVMAAAVVNWIPKEPFSGKMPTEGYKIGDTLTVPFILAPRVIDEMRRVNKNLTLIGCKMTIDAAHDEMIEAAYKTLIGARCHAVVANDLGVGLRSKTLLYPDRSRFDFDFANGGAERFYKRLEDVILDEHFHTISIPPAVAYERDVSAWEGPVWTRETTTVTLPTYDVCEDRFDMIVNKYRSRFVSEYPGSLRVFGAVAVRSPNGALCSPREKGALFTRENAVDVLQLTPEDVRKRRIVTIHQGRDQGAPPAKATLNAPLLLRHLEAFPWATAVLHLHEQLHGYPTVTYAPPGTVRDNLREIVGPVYNIEGHGCIATLDSRGEIWGKTP